MKTERMRQRSKKNGWKVEFEADRRAHMIRPDLSINLVFIGFRIGCSLVASVAMRTSASQHCVRFFLYLFLVGRSFPLDSIRISYSCRRRGSGLGRMESRRQKHTQTHTFACLCVCVFDDRASRPCTKHPKHRPSEIRTKRREYY